MKIFFCMLGSVLLLFLGTHFFDMWYRVATQSHERGTLASLISRSVHADLIAISGLGFLWLLCLAVVVSVTGVANNK